MPTRRSLRLRSLQTLRTKIVLIAAMASFVALATLFSFYTFRDAVLSKQSFLQRQLLLASVVAQNTRGSLAFRDENRAKTTLQTLKSETNLNRAILYTSSDSVLAQYPETATTTEIFDKFATGPSYRFTRDMLYIQEPVATSGQILGRLYLEVRLDQLHQDTLNNALIFLGITLIASLLSAASAYYLQRPLSSRVTALAQLANHVRKGGDFRHFPLPEQNKRDEVGNLSDAFLVMLEKLEARESVLRESENRFRTLIESMPFSVLELDLAGTVLSHNNSGLALKIPSRDLLKKNNLLSFVPRTDLRRILRLWFKAKRGEYSEFDIECTLYGKKVVTSNSLVPILEDDGQVRKIIVILQDITQRVALEKEIHHAQRMEAMGQLTGGVAHDFNNILSIVIGNVEMLKLFHTDDANTMRSIGRIEHSVKRATQLTTQLLGFARDKATETQVVDLREIIQEQESLYRVSLGRSIPIHLSLSKETWTVSLNTGDFEHAMLNLVINARDAMPGYGNLTITTTNVHLDQPLTTTHTTIPAGDYVEVSVSDEGSGIAPELLQRIFEPFFTTKEKGAGTGLGLAMVFGFVQRARGGIKVTSKMGVGTSIALLLPRTEERASAVLSETPELAFVDLPNGNETILIVDDEKALIQSSCQQLSELGYNTIGAVSADKAIVILQTRPGIDLVMSDIVMPGSMDGIGLAEHVSEKYPEIPVLLATGYSSKTESHNQTTIGSYQVLRKPFSLRDLAIAVRKTLDAR